MMAFSGGVPRPAYIYSIHGRLWSHAIIRFFSLGVCTSMQQTLYVMDNPRPEATIRRCLYRDLDSVLDIYNFYVSRTVVSLDQEIQSMSYVQDLYNSVLDQDLPFLVVTLSNDNKSTKNEEQILGYAYAHKFRQLPTFRSTVEILMYLDPDATGRGIGKNLLTVLMGMLKSVRPSIDLGYDIREVLAIVPVEEGRDASNYPTS